MADVSEDDEAIFYSVPPEVMAATNPFPEEQSVTLDLQREVNVTQLADEISALVGFEVSLALVNLTPELDVTHGGTQRLCVMPAIKDHILLQALADHEPDELYGFSDDQRKRQELVVKLKKGEPMTEEEMRQALLLALSRGA